MKDKLDDLCGAIGDLTLFGDFERCAAAPEAAGSTPAIVGDIASRKRVAVVFRARNGIFFSYSTGSHC